MEYRELEGNWQLQAITVLAGGRTICSCPSFQIPCRIKNVIYMVLMTDS